MANFSSLLYLSNPKITWARAATNRYYWYKFHNRTRTRILKGITQSLTTADPITFRKILNELAEKNQ